MLRDIQDLNARSETSSATASCLVTLMETGQTTTQVEDNQKTTTEECHLTVMISITPIVSMMITKEA